MSEPQRYTSSSLEAFLESALLAGGADVPSAQAATRAMMHASRLGVDSHGVRLLPYYLSVLASGEINGHPQLEVSRGQGATAVLDADGAIGDAAGTYQNRSSAPVIELPSTNSKLALAARGEKVPSSTHGTSWMAASE